MNDILMIKYGEIILKGLNRPKFEDKLIKNIKYRLYTLGEIKVTKIQATLYIEPLSENFDYDEAINRLKKVFGILYISRARKLEKNIDVIKEEALKCLEKDKINKSSYKVEVKRADKSFPMKSPEIQQVVGAYLYERFYKELKVDVKNPDVVVQIEIKPEGAYVYCEKTAGAGGLPLGINGKCALMLSGGIDSPVAGYMIAKRGIDLIAVHFHSYPYTSERAKNKVIELAKKLTEYAGRIELYVVPFTDIQLLINDKADNDMLVILMRRYMMRIAEKIARKCEAKAIVTGESLGQVASQTLESIHVTNEVAEIPVLRPLIGMDKEEITKISRKIDTFETSIQPYEDCCTVFVPKHPKTKPKSDFAREQEAKLEGIDELVDKAVENAEKIVVKWEGMN